MIKLVSVTLMLLLLLPACGPDLTPTLAAAGQPTLVFVYTDG